METRTTPELKKEVKKLLGINPRDYSLRRTRGHFWINITSPTVGLEDLKEYFNQFKHVDYCERTNEILMGGNTFVFVNYDYMKLDAFRTELREKIRDYTIEKVMGDNEHYGNNPWMVRGLRAKLIEEVAEKFNVHTDFVDYVVPRIDDCQTWIAEGVNY